MVYIDNIKEKDIEAILFISNQSEYIQLNENNIKFYLEDPIYKCLSIYKHNIMIGFTIISIIEYECEIIDLIILKEYQRQGYAQRLFSSVVDMLYKKNVSDIFLEVREDNYNAIEFYKKNKFSEIYRRYNYYNINAQKKSAVIMHKGITINK